jgi:hypothetical protein
MKGNLPHVLESINSHDSVHDGHHHRKSWLTVPSETESSAWRETLTLTNQERLGWFIVAALFLELVLVFVGGYNTVPVFVSSAAQSFPPLDKQVSIVPSVFATIAEPAGWTRLRALRSTSFG